MIGISGEGIELAVVYRHLRYDPRTKDYEKFEVLSKEFKSTKGGYDTRPSVYRVENEADAHRVGLQHAIECMQYPPPKGLFGLDLSPLNRTLKHDPLEPYEGPGEIERNESCFALRRASHHEIDDLASEADLDAMIRRIGELLPSLPKFHQQPTKAPEMLRQVASTPEGKQALSVARTEKWADLITPTAG